MAYRCPECGVVAEIDFEKKTKKVFLPPPKGLAFSFPSHSDCELAKPLDELDVKKLEKVKKHG